MAPSAFPTMLRRTFLPLLVACSLLATAGCKDDQPSDSQVDPCGWDTPNIEALDGCAAVTFGIFSDNKGDGPERKPVGNMIDGMKAMGVQFVLGLGDHVRGPNKQTEPFVTFIEQDPWWHANFYPTIADGENAYYGKGQWDWGAGKGLLDDLDLCSRSEVTCRDNGVEYHATWTVDGIEIHYISAHYPDQGDDPFPESSQRYLVEEVQGIDRKGKDVIVIAAAHTDNWVKVMPKEWQDVMLSKADLLLGATTHIYMRYQYPDDKALFLNTGSTGYSPMNNYLQVSVLRNPLRLIVQNMNANTGERKLRTGTNCWVKEIGGNVTSCQFSHAEGGW